MELNGGMQYGCLPYYPYTFGGLRLPCSVLSVLSTGDQRKRLNLWNIMMCIGSLTGNIHRSNKFQH